MQLFFAWGCGGMTEKEPKLYLLSARYASLSLWSIANNSVANFPSVKFQIDVVQVSI